MAKTTKFHTSTLNFGSKLSFLKANISKTARETYPQNFTMAFTCLKLLKNGFIVFGGVFSLGWILAQPIAYYVPITLKFATSI